MNDLNIKGDEILVFLDFDGVLKPLGSNHEIFDPDCLNRFEEIIREFQNILIVITSTWRVYESLDELRSYFSKDIRHKIIGKTPEEDSGSIRCERYREIQAYIKNSNFETIEWLAIDDDNWHFPNNMLGSHIILTDPSEGLNVEKCRKLRKLLKNKLPK